MMCDVMPTISEDSISQRSSQFGDEANFEQLMVSMLDERDKLVESLKNEQEKTGEFELRVKELEKERDSLNRQLNQNLPQVRRTIFFPNILQNVYYFKSFLFQIQVFYLLFCVSFHVVLDFDRYFCGNCLF